MLQKSIVMTASRYLLIVRGMRNNPIAQRWFGFLPATTKESRDGAVVRTLAFHQCDPGSNFGPGVVIGLSLLLVLTLLRGSPSGSQSFLNISDHVTTFLVLQTSPGNSKTRWKHPSF